MLYVPALVAVYTNATSGLFDSGLNPEPNAKYDRITPVSSIVTADASNIEATLSSIATVRPSGVAMFVWNILTTVPTALLSIKYIGTDTLSPTFIS